LSTHHGEHRRPPFLNTEPFVACVYLLAFIACVARVSAGLGGPCQFDLGPVFRRKTQDAPFGQTSLYPWVFFEMPGSSNSGLWVAVTQQPNASALVQALDTLGGSAHLKHALTVSWPALVYLRNWLFQNTLLLFQNSLGGLRKALGRQSLVWMACGRVSGFGIL